MIGSISCRRSLCAFREAGVQTGSASSSPWNRPAAEHLLCASIPAVSEPPEHAPSRALGSARFTQVPSCPSPHHPPPTRLTSLLAPFTWSSVHIIHLLAPETLGPRLHRSRTCPICPPVSRPEPNAYFTLANYSPLSGRRWCPRQAEDSTFGMRAPLRDLNTRGH